MRDSAVRLGGSPAMPGMGIWPSGPSMRRFAEPMLKVCESECGKLAASHALPSGRMVSGFPDVVTYLYRHLRRWAAMERRRST